MLRIENNSEEKTETQSALQDYYRINGELPPEIWCDIITTLDPETIITKVALVNRSFYEMTTSDVVMGKKLQQHYGNRRHLTIDYHECALPKFSIFRLTHQVESKKYSPTIKKWIYLLKEGDIERINSDKLNIEDIMPLLTNAGSDNSIFYLIEENQRLRDFLFESIYIFFAEKKLGYDVLYNGYTLLHYLAMLGPSNKLVKKLLPVFNASNPVLDEDGYAPLHYAISRCFGKTFALLLKHQAPINRTSHQYLPFYTAACNGNTDIIEFFYYHGFKEVDEFRFRSVTPLMIAARNGHILTADKLLDFGANPNSLDRDGATPLFYAAEGGCSEMIKLLFKRGATIDQACNDEYTPIFVACYKRHLMAVAILLELGADPDVADCNGNTALFVAAELGLVSMTELLINYHAKVNLQNNRGATALYLACQNNHITIVNQLLKAGASPYLCRVDRISPLHIAAEKGHFRIVEDLLTAANNINQQDKDGGTSILYAVEKEHIAIVMLLIKYGADPRIKATDGKTPLVMACILNNVELVKILVEAFPDLIYVTDNNGKRPIEYLHEKYQKDERLELYSYLKKIEDNDEQSTSLALK